MAIGIVLLTAGESKRMGKNKQLLPWLEGTILDSVCDALTGGVCQALGCTHGVGEAYEHPYVAVTGLTHDELVPILSQYGFTSVQNPEPSRGQGVSLQIGVNAVCELANSLNVHLDGIVCSVGDQPLLSAGVVSKLVTQFQAQHSEQAIVCPRYGESQQPGNPVLFGAHWFNELKQIDGDKGGRRILKETGKPYVTYVFIQEDMGVDVDTPDDYQRLLEIERSK